MEKYYLHNKIKIMLLFVLVFLVTTVLLMGCSVSKKREPEYPFTRVSVILPHSDDGYWSLIAAGIEEAKEEIGARYNIDIQIHIPQLNYNIVQITDILKQQVAAQVDVIVVQGNEDREFLKVLGEAREQGIQIICVDTAVRNFHYDLYIGTDNYEAGKMMGESLVKLTGAKADIAVVSGDVGYMNLEQRLEGLRHVLSDYPQMKITSVSYDYYDGLTFMNMYHNLSSEADVLACIEGTGGQTLSHTYTQEDTQYRYVVGFDAFTGIQNHVLAGVVKQDTSQMGRRVVEEIARYISQGSYSSDTIYTDIYWLTADNYDEVMQ